MRTEIEFNVCSFRKIPNPTKDGDAAISQMYTAICDVTQIPASLLEWMETNPRKQNINSSVAKKIKKSLLTGTEFHLLNRGILLSAEEVKFNNYDNKMKIVFSDPEVHGDVDGGHTLRVILENQTDIEPNHQFVKLEILTGVEGIFEDLAEARNTSTQVKSESIANLKDYFELIKTTVAQESYSGNIKYVEKDDGDIDVSEMLAILNMFNIDVYEGLNNFPVISYSSKKRCVDSYISYSEKVESGVIQEAQNPYFKMKDIMLDIFKLYDQLESKMSDYYRAKNPSGKYGLTTGVVTAKDDKFFTSKFYGIHMQHSSPTGFLYPILGALRALVSEQDGKYVWKKNPYDVLDKIGPELVTMTVERSRTNGNNPNKTGKESMTWQSLYMRALFEVMSMS